MARWYYDDYFPPSRPIATKGGIRAQSQRGGFGSTWWAQRWSKVLDSFGLGSRMARGRSYARQGQVLAIEFGEGEIRASVQGSRPTPYAVQIRVKTLSKEAWEKVAAAISEQAVFASKLLAGKMPDEMEQLFHAAGTSLFPEAYRDLKTSCSCPDASNPCKHIAAVYYLLGEEFDRDPFLIFRMRGITREVFLELLGGASATSAPAPQSEELPSAPAAFWNAPAELPPAEPAGPAADEAALPRRLGKFPLWRGSESLVQYLDRVYARAAAHAQELWEAGD